MSESDSLPDFEKICRLCLDENDTLCQIFKIEEDMPVPIHQMIMTCSSVIMYEGDGLPEQICSKCLSNVNQSYSFREQTEHADAQLKEILLKMQQNEMNNDSNLWSGASVCDSDNVEDAGDVNEVVMKSEVLLDDDHDDVKYCVNQCQAQLDDRQLEEGEVSFEDDIHTIESQNRQTSNEKSRPRRCSEKTAKLIAALSQQTGITITKRNNNQGNAKPATRSGQQPSLKKTLPNRIGNNSVNLAWLRIKQMATLRVRDKISDKMSEERRANITKVVSEIGMKTDDGKIYCTECKIFIGSPYFYNHVKYVHIKVRDHLCPQCGYRAQTGHILRQHIEAVHSEASYPCPKCDRTFKSKKSVADHLRSSHRESSKERKNICQFCGKGFFTAHYLRNHIRTHTLETPYKCQYCDRRFSFKWPCVTHERLHTGVKPYKCTFCPESFTQNCVRKNHEFRAHGNEEFNPKNRKPREGLLREKKKGKLKVSAPPAEASGLAASSEK